MKLLTKLARFMVKSYADSVKQSAALIRKSAVALYGTTYYPDS